VLVICQGILCSLPPTNHLPFSFFSSSMEKSESLLCTNPPHFLFSHYPFFFTPPPLTFLPALSLTFFYCPSRNPLLPPFAKLPLVVPLHVSLLAKPFWTLMNLRICQIGSFLFSFLSLELRVDPLSHVTPERIQALFLLFNHFFSFASEISQWLSWMLQKKLIFPLIWINLEGFQSCIRGFCLAPSFSI